MDEPETADFTVKIDFARHSPDPARVFRTAQELIASFETIDRRLAGALDSGVKTTLLLEDIEAGSLRIRLAQVLDSVDDGAVRELSIRKAVGSYLVKGKHILVEFLNRSSTITDRADIEAVRGELLQAAEDTNVRKIPIYRPLTPAEIVASASEISAAKRHLMKGDSLMLESGAETTSFDLAASMAPEDMEGLLTRESLISKGPMILLVRRPNYLGNTQWGFRHGRQNVVAKIEDHVWLQRFQARQIDVRPGDALRALVEVKVDYGFDNEVVRQTHTIKMVEDVLREHMPMQLPFDEDDDAGEDES